MWKTFGIIEKNYFMLTLLVIAGLIKMLYDEAHQPPIEDYEKHYSPPDDLL